MKKTLITCCSIVMLAAITPHNSVASSQKSDESDKDINKKIRDACMDACTTEVQESVVAQEQQNRDDYNTGKINKEEFNRRYEEDDALGEGLKRHDECMDKCKSMKL